MFWLKLIKKFVKILQSNVSPLQIAGGIALGAVIGLTPSFTVLDLTVFLVILLLNVNISSALFGIIVFEIIGYFIDPLAHQIGRYLLVTSELLTPFWTKLYNMPIVPFTRFNNTIMLGSLVISLILFIPIVLGMRKFIILYRTKLSKRTEQWKVMKAFKLSKIYNIYKKFSS